MVAWHLNFQFQVLALLKGIKELGVVHFTVDAPYGVVGLLFLQQQVSISPCWK